MTNIAQSGKRLKIHRRDDTVIWSSSFSQVKSEKIGIGHDYLFQLSKTNTKSEANWQ